MAIRDRTVAYCAVGTAALFAIIGCAALSQAVFGVRWWIISEGKSSFAVIAIVLFLFFVYTCVRHSKRYLEPVLLVYGFVIIYYLAGYLLNSANNRSLSMLGPILVDLEAPRAAFPLRVWQGLALISLTVWILSFAIGLRLLHRYVPSACRHTALIAAVLWASFAPAAVTIAFSELRLTTTTRIELRDAGSCERTRAPAQMFALPALAGFGAGLIVVLALGASVPRPHTPIAELIERLQAQEWLFQLATAIFVLGVLRLWMIQSWLLNSLLPREGLREDVAGLLKGELFLVSVDYCLMFSLAFAPATIRTRRALESAVAGRKPLIERYHAFLSGDGTLKDLAMRFVGPMLPLITGILGSLSLT